MLIYLKEEEVPAKTEEELKKEADELQKKIEKFEKEKKEKKAVLEKHFTLPKEPKVLVFPSKTAKSGKFDCKFVTLQQLLDYRLDDNKESQFEVFNVKQYNLQYKFRFRSMLKLSVSWLNGKLPSSSTLLSPRLLIVKLRRRDAMRPRVSLQNLRKP